MIVSSKINAKLFSGASTSSVVDHTTKSLLYDCDYCKMSVINRNWNDIHVPCLQYGYPDQSKSLVGKSISFSYEEYCTERCYMYFKLN